MVFAKFRSLVSYIYIFIQNISNPPYIIWSQGRVHISVKTTIRHVKQTIGVVFKKQNKESSNWAEKLTISRSWCAVEIRPLHPAHHRRPAPPSELPHTIYSSERGGVEETLHGRGEQWSECWTRTLGDRGSNPHSAMKPTGSPWATNWLSGYHISGGSCEDATARMSTAIYLCHPLAFWRKCELKV